MKRLKWIDNLKGFIMLLVVMGHCVNGLANGDMFRDSNIKIINSYVYFIYAFRMPAFLALSGYAYYLTKSYNSYKKRVLNFFIIYIIWSVTQWGVAWVAATNINKPLAVNDLLSILWKPIGVHWYLYSLMLMYIAFHFIHEKLELKHIILLLVVSLTIKLGHLGASIFSTTLFYSVYFALGGYLYLKSDNINKYFSLASLLICVMGGIAAFIYGVPKAYHEIFYTLFPLAVIISIFYIFPFTEKLNMRMLSVIGAYSLHVYLMHVYFTAGTRIALRKIVGETMLPLYILLGTVLGIAVPVLIAKFSKRYKFTDFWFNPIKVLTAKGKD